MCYHNLEEQTVTENSISWGTIISATQSLVKHLSNIQKGIKVKYSN